MGDVEVSIIDITNCFVFIHAKDLGLTGREMPSEIGKSKTVMENIEKIRSIAAEKAGIVMDWTKCATESAGSPKVVILSHPQDFRTLDKTPIDKEDMDLCVRIISVGQPHKATPISAATAIGGAAFIENTLIRDYYTEVEGRNEVILGHPSG
jgi:hypothetical protein